MNFTPFFSPAGRAVLIFATVLSSMMTGCASDSGRSTARVHHSTGYTRTEVIVDDDYVYYPSYEVYYSRNRQTYVYRDGRQWVSRPAPPRVSVDILLASPSVHVDFRDAPERHHAEIVRRYPKHWRPSERDDDRHDNRKRDRHDDRHDDNRRN